MGDPDAIEFVLQLGRALHRYGTPAHRLEEGLLECCERLELSAEVFTTPTTIIMSFGEPAELRTRMMRVEGGELDMAKLARLDALADAVASLERTPAEGLRELAAILASPPQFRRRLAMLAHAVTAGSLAVFFGGSLADVAIAAAIGLSLGVLAQYAQRSTDQARVFELVGAAFAAFAAGIASSWWRSTTPAITTVAALVILLPGLSLTVAMTELATRNLISGTARLMSAVIVLLELVVGVAVGGRTASLLVDVHQAIPAGLPEWSRWIALGASSIGVAIVVQAQPRTFGWILAACTIGHVGSRIGTAWLVDPADARMSGQLGVMVGAFAVGALANLYARRFQRPAQVVAVPAVLLLVPGSMGFRGMSSILDHQTLDGVESVFAMFFVATAIVAGLLVANAVVSPRRRLVSAA
ncbi:MAG TPA: threonine/serine exporter family protein [Kofleriaceae bacterium]|nr:threonine/serine exporter family protein [Kofleriaceae bacterium]